MKKRSIYKDLLIYDVFLLLSKFVSFLSLFASGRIGAGRK